MKNANTTPQALVVGASGATGRLLVQQLVNQGLKVKVIIRASSSFPEALKQHPLVTVITGSLLDFTDEELDACVADCQSIASCLGHNLTLKGVYGHPRRLVTEAVRRLTAAVIRQAPAKPVRFVLMNTTGNRNRDLAEPISLPQQIIVGLIRLLLPPHAGNEEAADFLRVKIGQRHPAVEWAVVRPDGLIDEEVVADYSLHPSPTQSAIFGNGKTSRINVGHFMASLMSSTDLWGKWVGQMPVIYNNPVVEQTEGKIIKEYVR